MGVVPRDVLSGEQRDELAELSKSRFVDAVLGMRARMVLWWDEGRSARDIAQLAGVSEPTARLWPARYADGGLDGLLDEARTGKAKEVPAQDRARILALTRASPPTQLGISHWSSRVMADYLARYEGIRVSHVFVADLWREAELRPWRQGTFKLSRDPRFEAKVTDVVGLYLSPPEGAVVLCVDEKSQCQALDRTQPLLPMSFGKTEKRTYDYVRHGTTTLFGALDVATGEITGRCYDQHRAEEFLSFMDGIAAKYQGREVHVVLDNFSTHSTEEVRKWLEVHPGISFHFTPTSSSWLNQIETWFSTLTRQAIRRGTFSSVRQLIRTIEDYIANWNRTCKPFTWTADADSILAKVRFIQSQVQQLTGH
jgi:transposase